MQLLQKTILLFLATIIVGCLPEVEAPDPSTIVEWENFMPSDGLAGSRVNFITQDSEDNLWIATDNGISKYDGTTFRNYNSSNRPLPSDFITSIVEFEPGFMVFGTDGGLTIFDGNNWQTIYFETGVSYAVLSMGVDAAGNGWVATDLYGLLRTDGNNNWWQYWDDLCYYCNFVNAITLDSNGVLWLGTEDGLKSRTQSRSERRYTTQDGLPDNYIQAVFEDTWGTLWVGTYNGLARKEGSRFVEVDLYNSASQNWTYTINEDSRRRQWFGTVGNGLVYFDGTLMRTEQSSLTDERNLTISSFRDKTGRLWFGTFEGGLWKYSVRK